MTLYRKLQSRTDGMAMVIVMTASFVVLVTIGVSAVLLANNLDQSGGRANRKIAEANAQSGIERTRGMHAFDGHLFDSCAANDCVDTTLGGCGLCSETIYSNADNRHQVLLEALTQPSAGGGPLAPAAGSATLLSTGFYKNLTAKRNLVMCLDYCTVTGRNCDADGCGGVCGVCTEPQSCGGAGVDGVCGAPLNCTDIAVECSDSCMEGDTCGGGVVINATNNIIDIGGGCQDTSGSNCNQGREDTVSLVWDNEPGFAVTDATDPDDGQINVEAIRTFGGSPEVLARFEAVKFCEDMDVNGFSDWYLPSENELTNDLLASRNNSWTTGFGSCYWASTEIDGTTAVYSDVGSGFFCGGVVAVDKSNSFLTRCIRRY